jgi:hypothetical protein
MRNSFNEEKKAIPPRVPTSNLETEPAITPKSLPQRRRSNALSISFAAAPRQITLGETVKSRHDVQRTHSVPAGSSVGEEKKTW